MEVKLALATARIGAITQSTSAGSTSSFSTLMPLTAVAPVPGAADPSILEARRALAKFDSSLPPGDPVNSTIYANGARQVSIAQCLPTGVYDFTAITPRQMTIVGGALIAGGIVQPAGVAGALDLAAKDPTSDTPVNFFAYLHQQAGANEKTAGGMSVAFQQRTAIASLTRVQSASGVPIIYDQNYPTAPRAPTAAEIDAKMTDAIAAFTKEATLTPLQRIRRDVLKDMNVTEGELKAMPPSEREAEEKKISEEVLRRLEKIGAVPDEDNHQTDDGNYPRL